MQRSTTGRPVEGLIMGKVTLLARGAGGGGSESEMPVGLRQLSSEVKGVEVAVGGRAAKRPFVGRGRGRQGRAAFRRRLLCGSVSAASIEAGSLPTEVRGTVCPASSEGRITLAVSSGGALREVCEAAGGPGD